MLRAQNMLSLYGGLGPYWHVIQQSLHKQSVHFVAASAYSVQAAKMISLSLSAPQKSMQGAIQARIQKPIKNTQQTNRHKAQAQHAITDKREKIAALLAQCHLSSSDIDHKDLHKLARIGIKTYADLCQLPVAEIANRVSRYSMSVINELLGKEAARLKFYQTKAAYHDYTELLYDISLSDKLLPVIARCLNKLSQFLLIRNAHSLVIEIGFFQREHDTLILSFNSIRPIYKSQDWLSIISLRMESLSFESPVFGLSIKCVEYEVAQVANDDMFEQKSTHVAAMTLLSRLQSKLGQQSLQRIHFVDDFRPELSQQKAKVLSPSNTNCTAKNNSIFADRPGLLLPHPEPLTLAVEVLKGPERIQTGWWDDQSINRDYYIGQSQDGQQVWIFKTPNKQWYLHGYFI
jgi:protein ImuB